MPGTFPWPRTEEEAVQHLRDQHGTFVRTLTEWETLFGEMRRPVGIHSDIHVGALPMRRRHQHSEPGGRR